MAKKKKVEIPKRYNDVIDPNLELTKEGVWLLMSVYQDDEVCRGEFIRLFKRKPKHVIYENWWKFVGPVFKEEELKRRW